MPPAGGNRSSLSETVVSITPYQQRITFGQSGVFSPGTPIAPPQPEPVRILDFRVGENTFWTPRSGEVWSFAQLRNLVEPGGFDLARLAIETRKDQVERLDWVIRPIDPKKRWGNEGNARIDQVTKLVKRPDGVRDFATWTRRLLEDLFVIDAPTVEVRRARGGQVIGLDVVDGATFKLLVDDTGRVPAPPAPAYEQVIKGRPWSLLTTDDLIYSPRNQRPHKTYGLSPIEQILTTIHIGLSRQLSQLNYFTDGTTPPGFLNAPEGWSPDQVREYYDWLVSVLAGNLGARQRVMVAPHGAHWQAVKDSPLKDEFDEWIARVVCYAFSLPPTAFVRQLNRSSAQTSGDTSLEEGLEPIKGWLKRWWDDVIQLRLGFLALEFAWLDDEQVDPAKQADIDDKGLRNGTYCINDILERHGLAPVPNGNARLIYVGNTVIPLEHLVDMSGKVVPAPDPPQTNAAGPMVAADAEDDQDSAASAKKPPASKPKPPAPDDAAGKS